MESNALCPRCQRALSDLQPVILPDGATYCRACCESMAGDEFEMETGVPFSAWIKKHPKLVMQYQPMELRVRWTGFLFTFAVTLLGAVIAAYGISRLVNLYLFAADRDTWRLSEPLGFIILGLVVLAFFGFAAVRGIKAYVRAVDFRMMLAEGVFELHHGSRRETFTAADITEACVVRPGTVGATEGALRLKDGRMLTLDTCLSDLHALRVVMDLRFGREFPPSADDLARIRRDKLRKIRGLAD